MKPIKVYQNSHRLLKEEEEEEEEEFC